MLRHPLQVRDLHDEGNGGARHARHPKRGGVLPCTAGPSRCGHVRRAPVGYPLRHDGLLVPAHQSRCRCRRLRLRARLGACAVVVAAAAAGAKAAEINCLMFFVAQAKLPSAAGRSACNGSEGCTGANRGFSWGHGYVQREPATRSPTLGGLDWLRLSLPLVTPSRSKTSLRRRWRRMSAGSPSTSTPPVRRHAVCAVFDILKSQLSCSHLDVGVCSGDIVHGTIHA